MACLGLQQDNFNLKVYTEALTGFSHVHCPHGLKNTLFSQVHVFETAPSVGIVGRIYILRTERRVKKLQLSRSSLRVNRRSCPLHELLQQLGIFPQNHTQVMYIWQEYHRHHLNQGNKLKLPVKGQVDIMILFI